MDIAIIVPARLASVRFPRKLLFELKGKPLILWTAERLKAIAPDLPLVFAIDSEALREPLEDAGFSTIMTDPDLPSGTDRLAAANREVGASAVINVQADEPLVRQSQVDRLRGLITTEGVSMATLATPFETDAAFRRPSNVKVVIGADRRALYFSRAPIPFNRDTGGALASGACFHHLGLYAYTADFLQTYTRLPKGRLEQLEKLEQLRVLENGHAIHVGITDEPTVGIDTPDDVDSFLEALGEGRVEWRMTSGEGRGTRDE